MALLLVTTTQAVFVLDFESSRAFEIERGRGVYYGATFDEDRLYVAARRSPYGADRGSQRNAILAFDHDLREAEINVPEPPLRDVHQIVADRFRLIATGCLDDALFIREGGGWRTTRPLPLHGTAANQRHINSVFADADGIWLAGRKPHGWVAQLDLDGRLVEEHNLGAGTHNVWRHDGDTFVLSSEEGTIRSVGGRHLVVHERGWLRGIAGDGAGSWFVGVCQNRIRQDRAFSDCSIVRIDPRSGAVGEVRSIRGQGMVHDIRLLGEPDDLHNRVAFSIDRSALRGSTLSADQHWTI